MQNENLEAVQKLAVDLRTEEPRSPSKELGGYELAARTLDKCRASLVGCNGEFTFNCPMDQRFFASSGIGADEFREFVATGADDSAVGDWIKERSRIG